MANKTVYEYAYKGDFDFVRTKVEEDPLLIAKKDESQRILLHWASVGGNFKLVTYLVELGSQIDEFDDTEATPLILASSAGHEEIVELLIKKGAKVNHKTNTGHSALQYAASKGWTNICKILLENDADINVTDLRGSTPLHRAASKGNIAIISLFMEFKDKLQINARDIYGNSPLHLACEEDRQEEALLLIENGADVNITNKERQTPLNYASRVLFRLIQAKFEDKKEGEQ
ncbi:unnamed protein product [Brassicogethes aeneus]|uniref:Ankyrin repeat domain-containing protein 54 n=1 Tax=Brassicogethes aeneus TaxID=1431903 RepID=A0A9P0BED2_BRAAE|nr:unnamed protein product [Brassicogethes aeneus]